MKGSRLHRVRPAALKSPRLLRIQKGVLSEETETGDTLRQMDLSHVMHARWHAQRVGQSLTRRLVLSSDGTPFEIRQHLARRAYLGGPDDMAFRAAIAETLRALAQAQPDLVVEEGPSEGFARLARVTGGLLVALGAGWPFWALLRGTDLLSLAEGVMPALLAALLGIALWRGYGPARARRFNRPEDLAQALETRD